MIEDILQDRAALYVSGAMPAQEREHFELVLEFHQELRALVAQLSETATAVALSTQASGGPAPSPALKGRIMEMIAQRPQNSTAVGLVVSGADGLVQWVNPAFTQMCGYKLDELSGKRLGPILQGEGTDRTTAERIRNAVREYRPSRETILNYHKNGTPYWVDLAITPILGDSGEPLWLIAQERELQGHTAA